MRFWATEGASTRLPSVENEKIQRVLFINNFNVLSNACLRPIAGGAIDRILACVRSYAVCSVATPSQLSVRSIAGSAFDRTALDRTMCDRSHITASEVPRRK